MRLHPKVTIKLLITDKHENIVEQHIDVAFRAGDSLADSNLIARSYEELHIGYYASPKYLEKYGTPEKPEDLNHHIMAGFRTPDGDVEHVIPIGSNDSFLQTPPRITVNNITIMHSIAHNGEAIAVLVDETVEQEVADGSLVRLFKNTPPHKAYIWVVYSSRHRLNAVTRTFLDFLFEKREEGVSLKD